MRRLLGLTLVVLAALALAGPASATAPERHWIKGPFAGGVISDFSEDAPAGTVFTDIDIFGTDTVSRDNGTKSAGTTVFVNLFRYTADDFVAFYEGSAPATVVVDPKFATARVTATDVQLSCDENAPPGCVPPAPFDLDATFTAIGPPEKRALNFHFVLESSKFVFHSIQTARPATFTATIDGVPVPGTSNADTAIGENRDGEICRGPAC